MSKRFARILPSLFSRFPRRTQESGAGRIQRNVKDQLDLDLLEDRILLSAAPLDAGLLDSSGDGIAIVDTTVDATEAADVPSDDQTAASGSETSSLDDSEIQSDADGSEHDDHEDHDEHYDVFGNEYHALPVPIDESSGSSGSINIDETSDSLVPLADTFHLHSNLGAKHTVYLDFDGHVTSGTYWNSSFNGGQDIVTPAFDLDGNTGNFSDSELQRIQAIWQRVAEDFIPFDVDVTTEAPTTDELIKSGSGDASWGVRVVIGGSSYDWYGSGAGGVAYRGSFNWSSDTPAFVFEAQLGNGNEKYTAEAISHEAGHTLGLSHDGGSGTSYYKGHGDGETGWAPIMGTSYYENLTQWSKGEYLGANNFEDDLAIITGNNGFGYRVDDFGDTFGTADELGVSGSDVYTAGIIETSSDYDVFSFVTGGGLLDLNIDGVLRGSNLDIMASLYDAVGTLVVTSNPIGYLDAAINVSVTAGQYFLQITGVGQGDPSTGYSDYGSLGQYFINGTVAPTVDSFVSISANDASQYEGTSGTTDFTFTVSRSGDTSQSLTVDYSVAGSGSDPADAADFAGGVLPAGTLSFAAGETTKTLTIQVAGDTEVEPDESFSVLLANPSGTTQLGTASAVGTILGDDVTVSESFLSISAADAVKSEGNSGTTAFTFTISRSGDTSQSTSVDYSVAGSGTDPADGADFYGGVLPAGTVSFAAGETAKTLTIQVAGDTEVEADEAFAVTLANPTGSAQLGTASAAGTILADDVAVSESYVSITATDAVHAEGDSGTTGFAFTVSRSGDMSQATSVDYSVVGSGTNQADAVDFEGGVLPSGTISFAAGEASKTLTIHVAGDTQVEGDETFSVVLANPTGGAELGTTTGDATLLNDDFAAPAGITVSPTSGLTTAESGSSASFSIVLDSRPTADVVINVSSLDTTEGVVDKDQLVFNESNWSVSQTVVVTGVDDTVRDGNVTYTVQVAAATSADANYHGLNGDDVQVTNQDDERGKPGSGGDGDGGGNNGGGKGGGPKKTKPVDGAAPAEFGDSGVGTSDVSDWLRSIAESRRNEAPGRAVAALAEALRDAGSRPVDFGTLDMLVSARVEGHGSHSHQTAEVVEEIADDGEVTDVVLISPLG